MTLPFLGRALTSLEFLETEYSFHRTSAEPAYIRWESDTVFVEVLFDSQRSYELDARLGRLGVQVNGNEIPYGLDEISRCGGSNWGSHAVRACNEDELDTQLASMAQALRSTGHAYLVNDDQAYDAIKQQRERECTAYAQGKDLRRIQQAALNAWRNHDYSTVVALYNSHYDLLSASERKRLQIARKRNR